MNVARGLADADMDVTLVDRTNHYLFQSLLYQVAAGILAPGLIAPALRRTVKEQANARTFLAEVYHLDLERKGLPAWRMRLAEGHIPWRRRASLLGQATGRRPWRSLGGEAGDRRAQIGTHGWWCGRQRHPSTVATASRSSCPSAKAQSASSY